MLPTLFLSGYSYTLCARKLPDSCAKTIHEPDRTKILEPRSTNQDPRRNPHETQTRQIQKVLSKTMSFGVGFNRLLLSTSHIIAPKIHRLASCVSRLYRSYTPVRVMILTYSIVAGMLRNCSVSRYHLLSPWLICMSQRGH